MKYKVGMILKNVDDSHWEILEINHGSGYKLRQLHAVKLWNVTYEQLILKFNIIRLPTAFHPGSLTNQELINVYIGSDNPVIHVLANRLAVELDNPGGAE